MTLLIVGSRSITDFDLSPYVDESVDCIISGGAKGVDSLAETYANQHGLAKIIVLPQYDRYGRAAPLKRNEQMVELADEILVIWDGLSKGTAYTVQYAQKQGKHMTVIRI